MLARLVLIGMTALGTLPHAPVRQGVVPLPHLVRGKEWLRVDRLSPEISSLLVTAQSGALGEPENLVVQLGAQSKRDREPNPQPLTGMTIQVWLLRADGMALVKVATQMFVTTADGAGSPEEMQKLSGTEGWLFSFTPVPTKELAGVVVSVGGRLYVREIKVLDAALRDPLH